MDTIIYVRWSSAEQAKGHSKERQLGLCREHARHRGWRVIDEVIEEGQSAFTGVHRRSGKLGELQRDFEEGKYPAGVVLLVERLDRLSREAPAQFFLWLSAITGRGVTIATVDGNRTYSGASLDMASIIEVVVKASLANDESVAKSSRVASAWAGKRARLANGSREVMTRRAPAWLTVSEDGRAFVLDQERGAVIKRIFEETAQGLGKHTIARRLNEERIATFGRSSAWHASYIQKILNSPSVLGEFQPGIKPRGSARQVIDSPVLDYYPAAIDADLYARAKVSMQARARKTMGRGRRIANLFSGLGVCGVCGGKMTLRSKGVKTRADGRVVHEDYLVCDNMQRGVIRETGQKCHNNIRFNYSVVEKGVLDAILSEAMDDTHFVEGSLAHQISIEHAEVAREIARLDRKMSFAFEMISEDSSDDKAREKYREAREERKDKLAALAELEIRLLKARGQVSPEEHTARIATVREDLNSPDEDVRLRARTSVRQAIGELVEEMTFHRKGRRVGLKLLAGARNLTIGGQHGDVTFDIRSEDTIAPIDHLTDRQNRARERVLNANRARRRPSGSSDV